jgi:hypothetical protein
MMTKYNLTFDIENDFKYTKNSCKPGSYHYSIPCWNTTTEKLKEIISKFLKDNKDELIIMQIIPRVLFLVPLIINFTVFIIPFI